MRTKSSIKDGNQLSSLVLCLLNMATLDKIINRINIYSILPNLQNKSLG